jgi:hypothetical protein
MMTGFEKFNWRDMLCPVCGHRMSYHHATGLCQGCVQYKNPVVRCLEADPTRLAKILVYKERRHEVAMSEHMWKGGCTACFTTTQYWGFGATLGTMLEHMRRCSRFRYARSLEPTDQSSVSSAQRLSSSSGRLRTGGIQAGPPWVPPSALPLKPKFKCTCEQRAHFCFRHGCMGFTRGPNCTHGW